MPSRIRVPWSPASAPGGGSLPPPQVDGVRTPRRLRLSSRQPPARRHVSRPFARWTQTWRPRIPDWRQVSSTNGILRGDANSSRERTRRPFEKGRPRPVSQAGQRRAAPVTTARRSFRSLFGTIFPAMIDQSYLRCRSIPYSLKPRRGSLGAVPRAAQYSERWWRNCQRPKRASNDDHGSGSRLHRVSCQLTISFRL